MKLFFCRALLALVLFASLCFSSCSSHEFTTPARYREMVSFKGGSITGSASYASGIQDYEKGVFIEGRTVTLSAFKMAKYETTYQLWKEVYDWATDDARGANKYTFANPGLEGHGTDGTGTVGTAEERSTRPVTTINWRDAIVWCNAYSEMSGKEPVYYTDSAYATVLRISTNNSGTATTADRAVMKLNANGYRLPTEAEWEYAARGGDQSDATNWEYPYAGSNTIDDAAWYNVNSYNLGSSNADYGAHPVGTKAANKAGLYDMSGNVDEWCQDYEGSIVRGGGWFNGASSCTVAVRYYYYPYNKSNFIGFRFVCRQ